MAQHYGEILALLELQEAAAEVHAGEVPALPVPDHDEAAEQQELLMDEAMLEDIGFAAKDLSMTNPTLERVLEILGVPHLAILQAKQGKSKKAPLQALLKDRLLEIDRARLAQMQPESVHDSTSISASVEYTSVSPSMEYGMEEPDDDDVAADDDNDGDDAASLTTVRSVDTDEKALKSMEMLLEKAGYETRDLNEVAKQLELNEHFVVFLTKMTKLLNGSRGPPAKTPEAQRFIVGLNNGRTQIKQWERRAKKKFHEAKKGSNENAFMDQIHATQIKNLMKYLGPRVDEIFYRLLEQNEMTEHQVEKMTAPPQKSSRGSRSSASSTLELM